MRTAVLALLIVAAFIGAEAIAPLLHMNSEKAIRGSYIVILHDGTTVQQRDAHIAELRQAIEASSDANSEIGFTYNIGTFIGFSAKMSDMMLKQELSHSLVKYIEADQVVTLNEPVTTAADEPITQTGATWGIDRIDQRTLPLDGQYVYPPSAGAGVNVYVIDTGVLLTHDEFGGRAVFGYSSTGEKGIDGNGHGTHCAGTVAGTIYGVAKEAGIISVQVLNYLGSGTTAGVVAGVDFVAGDVQARGVPGVGSMSLGGGASSVMDDAVAASIVKGVPYAIAAGNSNANACNYSPARVPAAVTVGSTTSTDGRSSFSNVGPCVDIFAPGTAITAAWIGASNDETNTISGTSMATPHVAGVLAVTLGLWPTASPDDLSAYLNSTATWGKIGALFPTNPASPNALLYSDPSPTIPSRK